MSIPSKANYQNDLMLAAFSIDLTGGWCDRSELRGNFHRTTKTEEVKGMCKLSWPVWLLFFFGRVVLEYCLVDSNKLDDNAVIFVWSVLKSLYHVVFHSFLFRCMYRSVWISAVVTLSNWDPQFFFRWPAPSARWSARLVWEVRLSVGNKCIALEFLVDFEGVEVETLWFWGLNQFDIQINVSFAPQAL